MATPAERIIEALGGVTNAAKEFGLNRVWVWRWTQPRADGGTGGLIPTPQLSKALEISMKHDLGLTVEEMLGLDTLEKAA